MFRSKTNRYSTDISVLAQYAEARYEVTGDPSLDVLMYLAAAYAAVERLSNYADLDFKNKTLIADNIIHAYREALFVRSKRTDEEILDVRNISKFGRLQDGIG